LFDGAPTGVQISTPNMRDEECLQIATVVDEILNGGGHA
jgi:Asp-tRNA(Asn)/Glu-tRNA(Gln) amidotransferase A subunit family amidase